MLPEFTNFIFTIINTHLPLTQNLSQNTFILSKPTSVPNLIVAPECMLSSKVDTFSKVVLSFGKEALYLACVILVLNWFWPIRHLA